MKTSGETGNHSRVAPRAAMGAPLRARVALTAAGIGVGALAVVAALQWRQVSFLYAVRCLRAEPARVVEFLAEPPGTAWRDAGRRFLEEPVGRDALFRAWVRHLAEEVDYHETTVPLALTAHGGRRVWFDASYTGRKLAAGDRFCGRHEDVATIRPLLSLLQGQRFTYAEAPGYEFRVLGVDAAVALYRRSVDDATAGSVFELGDGSRFVLQVTRRERGRGRG